jgi:flagellin-specific chaperone FliS
MSNMTDHEADDLLPTLVAPFGLCLSRAAKANEAGQYQLVARHLDGVANIIEALASRLTKLTGKERAPMYQMLANVLAEVAEARRHLN